jgi:hypothetical protein
LADFSAGEETASEMPGRIPPPKLYRIILREPLMFLPFVVALITLIVASTDYVNWLDGEGSAYTRVVLFSGGLLTAALCVTAVLRFIHLRRVFRYATAVEGYVMDYEADRMYFVFHNVQVAYVLGGREYRFKSAFTVSTDYLKVPVNEKCTVVVTRGRRRKAYLLFAYTGVRILKGVASP